MGAFAFLVVYVLGGATFLPLVLGVIYLHAHLTFPEHVESTDGPDDIQDSGDDGTNIRSKAALADLGEKFRRGYEPDVAAGYFAVCREYVPGGVNGKPPERTTPAGMVVAPESPSVYQSMYRSIFDKRQGPTLDAGKGNGKPIKRARNVFFVVLRHGHLMLYDDSEQVDPRHVIFLEHHDVSVFSGEDEIPEGELFIKRNSIQLARKPGMEGSSPDTKPFHFFSENCSDKEDFYFAILHNKAAKTDAATNLPRPQRYEVQDIITLVQKLHSSEEHLQTRWINGLIGRLFLALYKTEEVEQMLRTKITKKIARVKKPAFLSNIALKGINLGEGAPFITNPRLKDLTVDGECCVEADFRYSGNFRLEVAATARIDLGTRFKAREVNLVLAVVIRKLEGHALVKVKPPPSNRLWISFEAMPYIDMHIEPIVSSRQITYNVIIRAIENRIREVIAETIVLPHWDDSPFADTTKQPYRGGIWSRDVQNHLPAHTEVPDEVAEDEAEAEAEAFTLASAPSPGLREDRTMSLSFSSEANAPSSAAKSESLSEHNMYDIADTPVPSIISKKLSGPPKAIRSRSFTSAADPLVSMENANIKSRKISELEDGQSGDHYSHATNAMMAISQRSPPISSTEASIAIVPDQSGLWEGSLTSKSKAESINSSSSPSESIIERNGTCPSKKNGDRTSNRSSALRRTASSQNSSNNLKSDPKSFATSLGADTRDPAPTKDKKYSTATLGAATTAAAVAAKQWGASWLKARNLDQISNGKCSLPSDRAGTPERPIGRGQPLPPPGRE